MTTLTVTSKGQVTLRKEVLKHLGIEPGDKLEFDLTSGKTVTVRAAARSGSIENFFGCLGPTTTAPPTSEEMNEVIADGWAGKIK
ncbi:MAG: AbrB/MazE/SpoVT family DNA-binding domain-containing protein [Pseudorhodoplanes sp.]